MKTFFTADSHLGHHNILRYCNRPFSSIEEHDAVLIDNWNSVVGKNDIVYHLGDFCFKNGRSFEDYYNCLNGKIYLIWGNHDQAAKKFARSFDRPAFSSSFRVSFLGDYQRIKVKEQDIILSHYSFRVWDKSHWGSWNLYGHSHGMLADNPHANGIDVGVDCHNYFPIEFEQVKEIMSKKLWMPIDHHGRNYKEARLDEGGLDLNKEDYEKLERKRWYEQLKEEFE